jgi:hypothetical protein
MKNLFFAFAISIAMVSGAMAQRGNDKMPSPEERASRQLERINKEVNLSAEQQASVKQALLKRIENTDSLRSDAAQQRKEMQQQRQAMRGQAKNTVDEFDTTMKSILSEEQYKKFKAYQQSQREQVKENVSERRKERPQNLRQERGRKQAPKKTNDNR